MGTLNVTYHFGITGTRDSLLACQDYLMGACGLRRTKFDHKEGTHPDIVTMRYGGRRQVERIFHLLYDDATIFLLRKYYALAPHFSH